MLRDIFSFQNLSTAQLTRDFTSIGGTITVDADEGRGGGACLKMAGSAATTVYVMKTYDSQQTWIVGYRVKLDSIYQSGARAILSFYDSAVQHLTFATLQTGQIVVYRGGTGGTLLGTTTKALNEDVSYYLEFKVKIDNSAGTVDIRVNGVSWLSLSSQDTQNAGNASANSIYIYTHSPSATEYTFINDIYIADAQTGSVTDFLGPQRVDAHFFTADGNYTDWTPSTGGNRYGVVDDNPANDDTDYATGAIGQKMTVKTCTFSYTPSTINGVKLTGVMKKTASGTINVKRIARKSSTDYESATLSPPDLTYVHVTNILETDPATSSAFTESDLESNIEWGFSAIA